MKIEVNIEKKHLYTFVLVLVLFTGINFVIGYGGSDPSVMGHSWGELDCDTDFCVGSSGVGIGTTSPSNALDVVGNAKFKGGVVVDDGYDLQIHDGSLCITNQGYCVNDVPGSLKIGTGGIYATDDAYRVIIDDELNVYEDLKVTESITTYKNLFVYGDLYNPGVPDAPLSIQDSVDIAHSLDVSTNLEVGGKVDFTLTSNGDVNSPFVMCESCGGEWPYQVGGFGHDMDYFTGYGDSCGGSFSDRSRSEERVYLCGR